MHRRVADLESSDEPHAPVAGRYIRLDVADSGVGMDDATRAQIFEPFFTTKGPDAGTGLGLATCYSAMKQLGGTIDVDSEVGKGTTFCLHFPVYTGSAEPESPRSVVGTDRLRGDETVLIIEDEVALRRSAERVLRQHGYNVLSAGDGIRGLEVFEAHKETIDLVLTDLVLPRGDGFHVAKEVRRQRPEVAVLLSSGYTDRRRVERDTSEFPIFWKPYTPAELARRIRVCLDEGAFPPGREAGTVE